MDHPPCDHRPGRSSPLQARALHFLKKLAERARGSGKKSRDATSPVAIPTQEFQRAHSSLDLLRKPDISRLIGLRGEDGPNHMDADDSSQDASASGNSPRLRPRRHSTWDSLPTSPKHLTFSGHGAAPLFFRDQAGLGHNFLVDDSGNVLAPASLFLRSTMSVDTAVMSPRSIVPSPKQISASPYPKPDERGVQDMPRADTPQPSGDVLCDNDHIALSTDPESSTSADTALSRTRSLITQEDSKSTVPKRPASLPRHSAPFPPPFRVTTERGLRLSPSIVTRQPVPLLKFPALPPPPPAPDTPPRQRVPLRSMPSLSRHGHSNTGCQADHEDAMVGDEDEEYGDDCDEEEEVHEASSVHQSDDEDEEPPGAGPSGIHSPKSAQKQRMRDDESLIESPTSPVSPRSTDFEDYVRSETYVKPAGFAPLSTSLAMYPFSPNIPSAEDANRHLNVDANLSKPRPSLYRVASRSMVNLGTRRSERGPGVRRPKSRETVRSNQGSASEHTTESHAGSEESESEAIGRLLRRTSMPSFHPTSDPPPYPTFDPRPKENRVIPREDEGREGLPPYSNSLYLIAIMPRKMEFSSPGVQARDRKWRRVVCELEGTTFRAYKCPPGASGAGVLGDWWEKRVGAGDVASPNTLRTRKKEEQHQIPAKLEIDDFPGPATPSASSVRSMSVPPTRQRRESQSSMVTQHTMTSTPRRLKRASGASFLSPFRSSASSRPEASVAESSRHREPRELEILAVDAQDSRSSLSHESADQVAPVPRRFSQVSQPRSASRISFFPVATGRAQWRNEGIRKPPESDLLRAYTLQHAESGLGNDYLKRKNVIRVRLEGEQFLLQAPDVPSVVEWIEGLHAGTNIALDIDQRPMPRGPMFPRRRRRRARRPQGGDVSGQRSSGPEMAG